MLTRVSAFLALALSGAAQPADLLVHNVKGYTLNSSGELKNFDALLIDKGRVLAAGSLAELSKRAGDAKKLDGQQRVLLPGLIDAHGHIMGLGHSRVQADLAGTKSLAEALERVTIFAKANPQAQWIRGRGWNQEIWKLNRFPTALELDAAIAGRPVWLERVDGHAGWANTLALQQAGITQNTRAPEGGSIERDAQGKPTGVLVDAAMALVEKIIPKPTRAESESALNAALQELASVGLTSVHDAGIDAQTFALYQTYAAAGKLSLRIYAMIGGVGEDFERLAARGPQPDDGSGFLSLRSVKLYADGALGSRGAALIQPYSDSPDSRGLLFYSEAELIAQIRKAQNRGFQVNVHAIGDKGNRAVLNAFASQGEGKLRHRIEHAQVVSLNDIPRFKQPAVIASMQPTHATSDMNMAEARVGPERIKGAYAWRRFLQAGVRIAAGSDFPVESPNPFWGLHAAVTRQNHSHQPAGGWYPDQALNVVEAFRAFTLDAAYAGHQENQLGTLESGKQADFILVDRDIFNTDPKTLWQTQVLETYVAGQRVYQK